MAFGPWPNKDGLWPEAKQGWPWPRQNIETKYGAWPIVLGCNRTIEQHVTDVTKRNQVTYVVLIKLAASTAGWYQFRATPTQQNTFEICRMRDSMQFEARPKKDAPAGVNEKQRE